MNIDMAGARRALRMTALARLAEAAASCAGRQPVALLRGARRGREKVARSRQTGMYLAHVALGLSLTRVGICFGRDRTTVRHACSLLEDGRDDPARECALAALEAGLVACGRSIGALPAVEPV